MYRDLREAGRLLGKTAFSVAAACGSIILLGLVCWAFNGLVTEAKAQEIRFYTATGFICDTPAFAGDLAREAQVRDVDAIFYVNEKAGKTVCKLSKFAFAEHSKAGEIVVNNKLFRIERVVIITMLNRITRLWSPPAPGTWVQYLLIRIPGTNI